MPENIPPNDVPAPSATMELDLCRERYVVAVNKLEAMKRRNLETLEKLKKCRERYSQTAAKMENFKAKRAETMEKLTPGNTSKNLEMLKESEINETEQSTSQLPQHPDNQSEVPVDKPLGKDNE